MYLLSSDFRAIASSFCWLDYSTVLFNCPYCRKFLFKLPSTICTWLLHTVIWNKRKYTLASWAMARFLENAYVTRGVFGRIDLNSYREDTESRLSGLARQQKYRQLTGTVPKFKLLKLLRHSNHQSSQWWSLVQMHSMWSCCSFAASPSLTCFLQVILP